MVVNKTLALYNAEKVRDGISVVDKDVYVRDVDMDFQPYNSALLLKNYGYNIEVTNRLFIDDASDIGIGAKFKEMDGDNVLHTYVVQKTITWNDYSEIFILEVANK